VFLQRVQDMLFERLTSHAKFKRSDCRCRSEIRRVERSRKKEVKLQEINVRVSQLFLGRDIYTLWLHEMKIGLIPIAAAIISS
jgi:hypothetical protein